MSNENGKGIKGRTLYLPPMTQAGSRMLAAVFRSGGVEARPTPPSDVRTMELGSMFSEGDECLPKKITLGDFLKLTEAEDFDPKKTAFFMPTANGPCRFGQYRRALETILEKKGLDDVLVLNPNSKNGYEGVGEGGISLFRSAWLALLASDVMRKVMLKTRPYEKYPGETDAVYEESLQALEHVFEVPDVPFGKRRKNVRDTLTACRDKFRAVDADYVRSKPLIAVVGEIFCRHNRFANENIIRKLEEYGAEVWIADVGEWVMYTDWSRMQNLKRWGRNLSWEMITKKIKRKFMKADEHFLLAPFHDDFKGYEEPEDTAEMAMHAEAYLPATGALGEMSLSVGRSVWSYYKGVDGVIDISPFSCMNGIVSEAVYPAVSRDHNDIPCRVFYFDEVNTDLDRDVGIFLELVRAYRSRKNRERIYPDYFQNQ